MLSTLLLIGYSVLIVIASLAGGWLPKLLRLTHTRMQLMMSLVGGLMLGVGLLHLIPHAYALTGDLDWCVGVALIGLLFMFAMIRILHVHQHGALEGDVALSGAEVCEHDHAHDHAHAHHAHGHKHHHGAAATFSWVGLAIGLALHTLIDGMALGASVASEAILHGPGEIGLLGVGTFLAVVLHKPLDAMAITTVMDAGKWSDATIGWVNFAFSLMCPLGAALFYFGVDFMGSYQSAIIGGALAFSGGVFLCISLADILPEVSFHSHDRFSLTAALLIGVLLAYGIGFLEKPHTHDEATADHVHAHDDGAHDHDADDHDIRAQQNGSAP